MSVNKFVYHGETKFDLTGDTVSEESLAKGITAHDKTGALITGTSTKDVDSTDATVAVGEILFGKTGYARGAKITGTMPNNGGIAEEITTKNQSVSVPQGYHDGSGSVVIAKSERDKIIGQNIRKGVVILGQAGEMEEDDENPESGKVVTPTTSSQTITPSSGYTCFREVTVNAIPYSETPNSAGGVTITIG